MVLIYFWSLINTHFLYLIPKKFLLCDGSLIFESFCPKFLLLVEIHYLHMWSLTDHAGMPRLTCDFCLSEITRKIFKVFLEKSKKKNSVLKSLNPPNHPIPSPNLIHHRSLS